MADPAERSSSERATSPELQRLSDPAGPEHLTGDGNTHEGGEAASPQHTSGPQQVAADPEAERTFDAVVHSDIGVEILLGRLKQSIAAHRDLASFFKEMSSIYEKHSAAQKKVARATMETLRASERKHGQYAQVVEETLRRNDSQGDIFGQFGLRCSGLWEELTQQAKQFDEHRKTEKVNGLAAEKQAQGAEEEMMKARQKRDRLAEELDRFKTGDRQGGRFGRLGTKSAAQQEEDLTRKLQAADSDYQQKTQTAQAVRSNLLQKERPATVHRLLNMVRELDGAICAEMSVYVNALESAIGHCGMQMTSSDPSDPARLANRIVAVNQEADFKTYINSFAPKIGNTHRELKYEPHPTQRGGYTGPPIQPTQPAQPAQPASTAPGGPNAFRSASGPLQSPPSMGQVQQHQRQFSGAQGNAMPGNGSGGPGGLGGAFPGPPHLQTSQPTGGAFMGGDAGFMSSPQDRRPGSSSGVAQISGPMESTYQNGPGIHGDPRPGYGHTGPVMPSQPPAPIPQQQQRGGPRPGPPQGPLQGSMQSSPPPAPAANNSPASRVAGLPQLSPDRPTFNMRLQALYERDGSPVPIIVHQCLQAIDMYGLKVDGIYRVSGSSGHIARLRQMFDHDPASIDFRNPETFFHDINSVTGLLKQFFRDLPGGLLTELFYRDFIQAAKIEDADARRDNLHATINALPDTNYATLRALCLHLWRVQEHEATNRMTSANLAICFGPTILVPGSNRDLADAGWQVKAMETVFANTLQIFDDD